MPVFHDQLNRAISLPAIPKRIISVVPSQTELLFYLGLDAEVIGITKFCIHPADKFRSVTKVGGTKQLNIARIKALHPDLIIANKEENDREQIEQLAEIFPVWISDISNVDEALDMIKSIGSIVDRELQSVKLCTEIKAGFDSLNLPCLSLRAAYFIWRKPFMAAGKKTYIDSLLKLCGLNNVFDAERYPEITADELITANPDLVLLSSEPYPFGQKHIDEFRQMLPKANIILVDGEMFSWYGSRLLYVPAYIDKLMNQVTTEL